MRLIRVLLPAFLFLLAATGCANETGVGALGVSWILGGPGCGEDGAAVATVRVRLLEDGYDVLQPPPTATCDQGFAGLDIVDVPAGRFTLLLEGLTSEGRPDFEGRIEDVRIRADSTTLLAPVVLTLKPASLRLRWGFRDGALCGSHGVLTMQATLIDDLGNEVLTPTPFPCELPLAAMDAEGGVLLTGLPARRTLSILLYGMNVDGVAVRFGYGEVDTAPGETSSTLVRLDTCGVDEPCL